MRMNKFTLFMENEFNRLETAYKMTVLEESMIKNDYGKYLMELAEGKRK